MSPKLVFLAFVLLGTVQMKAQFALGVDVNGQTLLVHEMRDGVHYAQKDGKLVRAGRQAQLSLIKLNEYLPFLVEITDEKAGSSSKGRRNAAAAEKNFVSGEFHYRATIASPYRLENVFLVLDLSADEGPRRLYAKDVGALEPHQKRSLTIIVPLRERLGGGRYKLYVMSDGAEVLTTKMPAPFRESKLRQIVANRLKDVQNSEVKPLFGPDPILPRGVLPATVVEPVVLRFAVDVHGRPSKFELVSSPRSEMAPAAIAAAEHWRFLPKVVDGRPIETTVEMPFAFGSPR